MAQAEEQMPQGSAPLSSGPFWVKEVALLLQDGGRLLFSEDYFRVC